MFYAEVLRGRKILTWTFAILGAACVLIALIKALFSEHVRVAAGDDASALAAVVWTAALVSAIIGSMLGAGLANENCHLELAWTKPISRARYAAGIQAVGLGYLLLTFAGTLALGLVLAAILKGRALAIPVDQKLALQMLRAALFPIAWFGLTQALTAGVRSNASGGWVVGLSWPTAEGLSIVATLPLVAPLHATLAFVNLANPIGYFPFWETFDDVRGHSLRPYFGFGLTLDAIALLALAVFGLFVATARWRRREV